MVTLALQTKAKRNQMKFVYKHFVTQCVSPLVSIIFSVTLFAHIEKFELKVRIRARFTQPHKSASHSIPIDLVGG